MVAVVAVVVAVVPVVVAVVAVPAVVVAVAVGAAVVLALLELAGQQSQPVHTKNISGHHFSYYKLATIA